MNTVVRCTPRSFGRRLATWTLVVAAVATLGCARTPMTPGTAGVGDVTSPKLSRFTYFEDGALAFVAVDVRSANLMKEGSRSLLPIAVALANNSQQELDFSRESFTLETSDGQAYPVASHEEYLERYDSSRADANMAETFIETLRARYTTFTYLPWRLFPLSGENATMTNSVELPRRTWTVGYLYFPIPEGGAKDRDYSLLVRSRSLPETLVVRFRVN